jgi:nitroimidazol reductase NimA-like FMN-containing flavoprotein (pyridoxamine 5'-phosphate oxidase superfamily)
VVRNNPVSARTYRVDDTRPPATWDEATSRLRDSKTYWVATIRPEGTPHVMPVLGVWVDGAFHFCAGAATRKARNLARDPHCVVASAAESLDIVLEGVANRVEDASRVKRAALEYMQKYGWDAKPRGSAFHGEGAPTAGPAPLDLYELTLHRAFTFGTNESINAMRWEFAAENGVEDSP